MWGGILGCSPLKSKMLGRAPPLNFDLQIFKMSKDKKTLKPKMLTKVALLYQTSHCEIQLDGTFMFSYLEIFIFL